LFTVDHILWAAYLLLGPGICALMLIGLRLGHVQMNRLMLKTYHPPAPAPRATILIPAKDEAGMIGECLLGILQQDYPNFQVIAINDRSTDDTGKILDELAKRYANMRVLHVPEGGLPPGWSGKSHALHLASAQCDGEWLLFVDSDVLVQPRLLSQAVGLATERNYDALSLLVGLRCVTLWDRLIQPAAAGIWAMMNGISFTNNSNHNNRAAANGAVFLIRRSSYERVGGHAAVKFKPAEDVSLMRIMKTAQMRTRLVHGHDLASTQMYGTAGKTFRGWGRIYAATAEMNSSYIFKAIALMTLCGMTVYPALACGFWMVLHGEHWHWLSAALLHTAALASFLGPMYRLSGNRARYAALAPITLAIIWTLLIYSWVLCKTGKISWRGTSYAFTGNQT
jgi:chlorobactene glucosyltransferase